MVYRDERPLSRFGFCVQLVVKHSINLMLTLISFFDFVKETDGGTICIRVTYSGIIPVVLPFVLIEDQTTSMSR